VRRICKGTCQESTSLARVLMCNRPALKRGKKSSLYFGANFTRKRGSELEVESAEDDTDGRKG
jgi:hypothetical protein